MHSDELSEYVGISAPLHAMDGWSLLGRSVHCLLRGDHFTAVHLAYYAELRATLAILASQGIGIFDHTHCVIDANGSCYFLKPTRGSGIHQWTWQVFEWWAAEPRAIELIRTVIRPGGESLGTWLEAMNRGQFALESIGTTWLRLWGMDIRKYFGDRQARNDASYWPNTINNQVSMSAAEDLQAVSYIWSNLEPTSASRFATLDKHLLRIVLLQGYIGVTNKRKSSKSGRSGYEREVEALLSNMDMTVSIRSQWKEFLIETEYEEPMVVQLAKGQGMVGGHKHALGVMSRATLLLRIATGASAMLLADAEIDKHQLDFWIQDVGTGRGIWQPEEPPEDLVDLWADVEYELDTIDDWSIGTELSTKGIWAVSSRELSVLGECERIGLWGLGF